MLDEQVRELLDGRPFAVLATLNSDGTPQTSVIWAARDGDVLIFTTHDKRQKVRNLRRDPRASATVSRWRIHTEASTFGALWNWSMILIAACQSR
jgi:PPOX class probable F420-dependent enzyme